MDSHTCAHDIVLALQVRLTKSVEVGCAVLAREVGSLVRLLGDAEVQVDAVLTADELAYQLLRTYEAQPTSFDPLHPAADPWPMAMEECWSSVRVDAHGARHVLGGGVAAGRGAQRLPGARSSSSSARATFSVVMEPLGADTALRKVEASRTADLADSELRGAAVSSRRPVTPASRRCWPAARRSWPRATRRSAIRASSRCPHRARRNWAGVRRAGPRGGPEPVGAAPPLRRPGLGLHLHAAAVPRACAERGAERRWLSEAPIGAAYHGGPCRPGPASPTRHPPRPGRPAGAAAPPTGRPAARQPEPPHARVLRRGRSSRRPTSIASPPSGPSASRRT